MPQYQRIGLHVSAAGGAQNAPDNAKEFGAEVFQFFSRSPRGGGAAPISDETAAAFKEKCAQYGFESYIHSPYYINFAAKRKNIFYGSVSAIREELARGTKLGVKYVVTHLGSAREWVDDPEAVGTPKEALDVAVKGLREIFKDKPKFTSELLLEISAGAGSVVGDTFEELQHLLAGLDRDDVHVCLDTAHLFASGYDVRTKKAWDETLKKFDKVIGLSHLKLVHVNDSKVDLAGRRDRHEHLGHGFIGEEGFKAMLAHPKLQKVNFILETKHDKLIYEDLKFLKKHRHD
jgi:deoxyribonuclease IV